MRKSLNRHLGWILLGLSLGGCSLWDWNHNQDMLDAWGQGLKDIHEMFDHYFLEPM